jgi:hypothetical protein
MQLWRTEPEPAPRYYALISRAVYYVSRVQPRPRPRAYIYTSIFTKYLGMARMSVATTHGHTAPAGLPVTFAITADH